MKLVELRPGAPLWIVLAFSLMVTVAAAQQKINSTYNVAPKALVSVTNHYGSIIVKPSATNQVTVQATSRSQAVRFENEQHGNRVELHATSKTEGDNLVQYTVFVPSTSWVILKTVRGKIFVDGIARDAVIESTSGEVEVVNALSGAHLHIKTLGGPVRLSNIHHGNIEVHSISGDISLENVSESSVSVNTNRGRVDYAGDPGRTGDFNLSSHSGDLDISIPAKSPVRISSNSLKGDPEENFAEIRPPQQARPLIRPGVRSVSRFVLRSFSGKIHLRRP
jgi:DUF4097 and DUF4098 domain-containing protein YvlB